MTPSNPLRLVNVYREPRAALILYSLLNDRPAESAISHKAMPTYDQHVAFVRSRPYRMWFLIRVDGEFVGDIHVTELNEIGMFLFRMYRGKGYGTRALRMFMGRHRPRGSLAAVRIGKWLANVAPGNESGRKFFRKAGFTQVQETYAL